MTDAGTRKTRNSSGPNPTSADNDHFCSAEPKLPRPANLRKDDMPRVAVELKIIMINHGDLPFPIRRGERIAQLVPAAVTLAEFDEVDELCETARGAGGFGSTGGHGS